MIHPQFLLPQLNTGERAFGAVQAGYGQITDRTTQAQTVTAGWTPVLNYDTALTNPIGVTQNLANGTLAISTFGKYVLIFGIDITFTSLNSGRKTYLRLFNVTDNVVVADITIPIGRDVDAAVGASSIIFTVTGTGKTARLEIGGGDALANCQRLGANFGVYRISA